VSDALVIVVSEETGRISVAMQGVLTQAVTPEYLGEQLQKIQYKNSEAKKSAKRKRGAES